MVPQEMWADAQIAGVDKADEVRRLVIQQEPNASRTGDWRAVGQNSGITCGDMSLRALVGRAGLQPPWQSVQPRWRVSLKMRVARAVW